MIPRGRSAICAGSRVTRVQIVRCTRHLCRICINAEQAMKRMKVLLRKPYTTAGKTLSRLMTTALAPAATKQLGLLHHDYCLYQPHKAATQGINEVTNTHSR